MRRPRTGERNDYFPTLLFDGSAASFVEIAERDRGNSHSVTSLIGENGFPENIDAVARVNAVELFGKSAD